MKCVEFDVLVVQPQKASDLSKLVLNTRRFLNILVSIRYVYEKMKKKNTPRDDLVLSTPVY